MTNERSGMGQGRVPEGQQGTSGMRHAGADVRRALDVLAVLATRDAPTAAAMRVLEDAVAEMLQLRRVEAPLRLAHKHRERQKRRAYDGHHPVESLDLFAGLPHIDSMPVGLMTLGFAREDRPYAYIVGTTAFLAEDAACRRTWADLKATVAAIEAEVSWAPESGTRCLFCPYFRDGCALDRPGGEEMTADWLDGVDGGGGEDALA